MGNIKKLLALGLIVLSLVMPVGASAASCGTSSQPRDCDSFSIMWGGAWSKTEFINKINNGDGHYSSTNLKQIYYNENRGITEANFKSASTVDGIVLPDGRVFVNNKLVATQAAVVGRNFLAGSTKDGSVWSRPIPDPFRPATDRAAWVNMEGGVYHYAIIKACGNAVRGKAVPKPTPTPTPTPTHTPTPTPTPTPAMSFSCVQLTPSQPDTNNPKRFRFTVTPKTSNVTVTGYHFIFSDGSSAEDTAANMPYVERIVTSGSLKVSAQVKTTAGTTPVSEACSAKVSVKQETPTPTPTGQVLGVTLPDTGPEAALGGIAGLTTLGYATRVYMRSRKSLLDSLRGRNKKQ